VGRFELADRGTLFLDEVGDLRPEAQAKLLRVLESGVIERLGGEKPVTVDVRVIAATNKDLSKASLQGQFREDLLFRLNVLPIHIPPLRERPDDIPPLVQHLAARQGCGLAGRCGSTAGAVQLLASYPWPGNVRELANINGAARDPRRRGCRDGRMTSRAWCPGTALLLQRRAGITSRSMMFASSRTLPGQGYEARSCTAPASTAPTGQAASPGGRPGAAPMVECPSDVRAAAGCGSAGR